LSNEQDTEEGLARVRLIVGSRLSKYGSAEELAMIWTLGTGEHAFYTYPIIPLFRVSADGIPNEARAMLS
jgi:hypothetical protein